MKVYEGVSLNGSKAYRNSCGEQVLVTSHVSVLSAPPFSNWVAPRGENVGPHLARTLIWERRWNLGSTKISIQSTDALYKNTQDSQNIMHRSNVPKIHRSTQQV